MNLLTGRTDAFVTLAVLHVLAAAMVAHGQTPELRQSPCPVEDAVELGQWQIAARDTLATLLKIDDQQAANHHDAQGRSPLPLAAEILASTPEGPYHRRLYEIDARPDRRIRVVVTLPRNSRPGKTPAVICIHGHGGNRDIVYDETSVYRGFAKNLGAAGYVTLSTNVGQHEIQDARHRTLMGERLWDLVRVVDLAASLPEVDPQRLGCAGLSLGGEMAMWLGAMDTRMAATVSSGFLTPMENLRHGHCMCWDFPGLQQRYDFADIYSLICPRPLQCQNGEQERLPGGFPVPLAKQAMAEIKAAYRTAGHAEAAQLAVHAGGHVYDVAAGRTFLDAVMKPGHLSNGE